MPENKRDLESDLAKFDAYVLGPDDYAEIPEVTDEMFAKGVLMRGGKPVVRGRPKSAAPKQQVTLRLDRDVLERFRAGGEGWQSRINEALRQAAGLAYGGFSEDPERGIEPPHDKRRRPR
ncbi:MAG TPA: BrnA antitoxin family protein [Caulobacteraceae bacterium]|jgi:uncharacterized protein (DUF4415 family)|nr:BrnA antitoxin family protein [Caulobacteraceae bacterium]